MESLTWKQINKMDKEELCNFITSYYYQFSFIFNFTNTVIFLFKNMSSNQLKSDLWYIVKQLQ